VITVYVTLGHEPKTARSKRTVPVARSVIRRLEEHLATFVGPEPGALVFTAPRAAQSPAACSVAASGSRPSSVLGSPASPSTAWRHSFVAILVAAGCNLREVSEWAGHNSVAFTLTRDGGLFENGSEAAVDRLDLLLGGSSKVPGNVLHLDTRKLR
jgi:integrase